MASSAALKAAKKELRSLMKSKLSSIAAESIDAQSAVVFKNVTSLELYRKAKRIGIYLSMPNGEVQTDAIVRHAFESGKQVFVPYLHKAQNPPPETPRSVMEMVDLRSLLDYESLQRDSWGIPTIDTATVEHREHILKGSTTESKPLDMIIMPGVAFDIDSKTGYVRRLGHGKGFYDYFLHNYMQNSGSQGREATNPRIDVSLCGLALHEQYLTTEMGLSVPVGEHDNLLHSLVVGDGKVLEGPLSEHGNRRTGEPGNQS